MRERQVFIRGCSKPFVVFDEIHQLRDPARVLKIGADGFQKMHFQARLPGTPVRYWRDKSGREVDFVLPHRRDDVDAIECKWDPGAFDSSSFGVFRSFYPKERNYLLTPFGDPAYTKRYGNLAVRVCTSSELRA